MKNFLIHYQVYCNQDGHIENTRIFGKINFNFRNENNVNFLTQCKNIIQKIKQNKNSWPFLTPVNKSEVPDYYDVIKEPMGKFNN